MNCTENSVNRAREQQRNQRLFFSFFSFIFFWLLIHLFISANFFFFALARAGLVCLLTQCSSMYSLRCATKMWRVLEKLWLFMFHLFLLPPSSSAFLFDVPRTNLLCDFTVCVCVCVEWLRKVLKIEKRKHVGDALFIYIVVLKLMWLPATRFFTHQLWASAHRFLCQEILSAVRTTIILRKGANAYANEK